MRHKKNRTPHAPQLRKFSEERFGFLFGKHRRGLIENEDVRLGGQLAENFDLLAATDAQAPHRGRRFDCKAVRLCQNLRLLVETG